MQEDVLQGQPSPLGGYYPARPLCWFPMQSFKPPILLRSRHLQSILGSSGARRLLVRRRAVALMAASRDEIADCGNGVRLLLHHAPPLSARPAAGVAVLIHGWEGSGDATYLLSAGRRLRAAGYRVVRLNLRDHGASHHLNRELFHSCRLDEVVGAVRWVQQRFPEEPLVLGGFSLGGNFALRVAAKAPAAGLRIRQVAAICPVLDPAETMHALDNGWQLYQRYFLAKWRASLLRKARVFPDDYAFGDLRRFRTLAAMTEFFVRQYAGYADLQTYLQGYALTEDCLADLQVPSRVLLAEDDPVIPIVSLQRVARTATLHVDCAQFGGHCAFLKDYRLRSLADDYLLDSFVISRGSRSEALSRRRPDHFRSE